MSSESAEEYRVPDDFPSEPHAGTLPGAQLKLLATQWNGRFYTGLTPPERHERWLTLEDLAQQFIDKLSGPRSEKYVGMAEVEILAQYLPRLYQSDFGSEAEMRWLIRRIAAALNWPVPASARPI